MLQHYRLILCPFLELCYFLIGVEALMHYKSQSLKKLEIFVPGVGGQIIYGTLCYFFFIHRWWWICGFADVAAKLPASQRPSFCTQLWNEGFIKVEKGICHLYYDLFQYWWYKMSNRVKVSEHLRVSWAALVVMGLIIPPGKVGITPGTPKE